MKRGGGGERRDLHSSKRRWDRGPLKLSRRLSHAIANEAGIFDR